MANVVGCRSQPDILDPYIAEAMASQRSLAFQGLAMLQQISMKIDLMVWQALEVFSLFLQCAPPSILKPFYSDETTSCQHAPALARLKEAASSNSNNFGRHLA